VQAAGIHHLELTLLFLVLLVAGLTTLAQRFKTPYPIVLFIGGVVLSLLPNLPHIALNPDVVFLVILPPLLYVGGFHTSWRDFHDNIVTIMMLAFGLVGFTVLGIALATGWLFDAFDYRLGLLWALSFPRRMQLRPPQSPSAWACRVALWMFSKARAWSTTPAVCWPCSLPLPWWSRGTGRRWGWR